MLDNLLCLFPAYHAAHYAHDISVSSLTFAFLVTFIAKVSYDFVQLLLFLVDEDLPCVGLSQVIFYLCFENGKNFKRIQGFSSVLYDILALFVRNVFLVDLINAKFVQFFEGLLIDDFIFRGFRLRKVAFRKFENLIVQILMPLRAQALLIQLMQFLKHCSLINHG